MMLSPKEKAEELVNHFRKYANGTDDESDRFSPAIEKANAIQCALIAVKFARENPLNTNGYNEYLDEVKQEIEKL